MGVEREIRFPAGVPGWAAVTARLNEVGESPVVRMIDGLPAFPDEVPQDNWQELRIGLTGGMVTLHRAESGIRIVTWGTDDPALARARDLVSWAVAAAGFGEIHLPTGPVSAATFLSRISST